MTRAESDVLDAVLRRAMGPSAPSRPLDDLVRRIPDLSSLRDLPRGTTVWIRADLDTPATGSALAVDPRVASVAEVLAEGRARGWRMLLLAHRGRGADGTLRHVYAHLRGAGADEFVEDWFDEASGDFTPGARAAFGRLEPGDFALLENVRRYAFEMRLRGATDADLPVVRGDLVRLTETFRSVADVYVNEAIATCNENFSTAVLPLGMHRAVLGPFARRELLEHAVPAGAATLLCCAGAKWDKLRHLLGIVDQGRVEVVLTGGSLAVALLATAANTSGTEVPSETVHVARQVTEAAASRGVHLVLPVDFVLEDGSVVSRVPEGAWPLDVGPVSRARFHAEAVAWLERTHRAIAYANGVMGRFEEPRWADGTKAMVATLVHLQRAGASVYVGGGEGRAALEQYASARDVAHAFTAGGTLLRILGDRPLPFLEALAALSTVP